MRFLNRPIEGDCPYVWIDATYVQTRQSGRIVSVAMIIAVGDKHGWDTRIARSYPLVQVKPKAVLGRIFAELEPTWLAWRKTSDLRFARRGLKAAIAKVFKATWQRCRVHFMRNALAYAVVGIFRNDAAIIRPVGALLLEQNEEWEQQRATCNSKRSRRSATIRPPGSQW